MDFHSVTALPCGWVAVRIKDWLRTVVVLLLSDWTPLLHKSTISHTASIIAQGTVRCIEW